MKYEYIRKQALNIEELMEPVIIIKYTCKESLRAMPDFYIRTLEESIRANADDFDKLEEIRVKLINCRAEVDNLQAQIWANKNGYSQPKRSEYE